MHLIGLISSSTAENESNSFLNSVVFQMCFMYDAMMRATKYMNSLPFLPSSDQHLCLSFPNYYKVKVLVVSLCCVIVINR